MQVSHRLEACFCIPKSNNVSISACRVCAPDTKVRRLVVGNETKEAADLASLDLTSLISTTFVNDPDFCLYEDSVAKVVVTVTETNKTLEDPCQ